MDIYEILQVSVIRILGIALIVGVFNINKYWKSPSCWILLYLINSLIVEYVGLQLIESNNQWLYNLSGIIELTIISIMFYTAVRNKRSKLIILGVSLTCLIVFAIEAIFTSKSYLDFWNIAFGFNCLGISAICVVYLMELATTEKVIHQNRILLYWISIGLLIYGLVTLPVTVVLHNLKTIGNEDYLWMIQFMAANTMYICFIIGFIWSKKQNNY